MLMWLADYLVAIDAGFGVFRYLTLRAVLSALTALVISLLIGPWLIRKLSSARVGQAVRDDGPQSHLTKAGTPTMGGALTGPSATMSVASVLPPRMVAP